MNLKLSIKTICALTMSTSVTFAQKADSIKSKNLGEVTVTAFRVKSNLKELPQNIKVLGKKDMQGVPNESIGELLKKTSGIDIVEYPGFSANIGMRGFAPTAHGSTYTMMLINGIPSGTQNPSTIDVSNAQQIEILKGPYSSFFGSGAMAGVVNIATPMSKDSIHGNAGLSMGSFQTYSIKANAGGKITDKLNFDLAAKYFTQNKDYKTGSKNLLSMTEREKEIMDNKSYGEAFKNTQYKKYNVNARLGYDFNTNWQVNVYENVFVANHVLSNGNFWGTYGSMEKDLLRWAQSLTLDGKIGVHTVKFSPYVSNEDVNYYNNISDTNYVSTNFNYKTYGFILQDRIPIGKHSIIAGIDNYSQKYVNKQWSNSETRKAPSQPDYANIADGAFIQARFNFLENKLCAAFGARYDLMYFKVYETDFIKSKSATETYQTFNPNIGVRYKILPGLNFNANAGTAFLAPDAFKKTGNYLSGVKVYKGNPNLKPEKSVSYDLAFSYTNIQKGLSADFTYFDNTHKGLMVYDRSNKDTTTFKNADNARMNGIELSVVYDFGYLLGFKYSLKVYGNLTHMLKDDVTVDTVTSSMKYVRKNNGSFGVEFSNIKTILVRLNARYIGHRYEDNWLYSYSSASKKNIPLTTASGDPIRPSLINETVLEHPDFLVIDLSGNYTFAKKYTIGLTVQNLFDENYTEKDGYYMPGRMITASFNYSF